MEQEGFVHSRLFILDLSILAGYYLTLSHMNVTFNKKNCVHLKSRQQEGNHRSVPDSTILLTLTHLKAYGKSRSLTLRMHVHRCVRV